MKKILQLFLLVITVFLTGCTFFGGKSDTSGTIKVTVIDIDNLIIKEKEISFVETDKLVDLVKANFSNVVLEGTMITSIETLKNASDWSTYICIKVNGEDSMVGIYDIPLHDGDHIAFVDTVNIYA